MDDLIYNEEDWQLRKKQSDLREIIDKINRSAKKPRDPEFTSSLYPELLIPEEWLKRFDRLRREFALINPNPLGHLVDDGAFTSDARPWGEPLAEYWLVNDGADGTAYPVKPKGLSLRAWRFDGFEATITFNRIDFKRIEMKSDKKMRPEKRPYRFMLDCKPVVPPFGEWEMAPGGCLVWDTSCVWTRPLVKRGLGND